MFKTKHHNLIFGNIIRNNFQVEIRTYLYCHITFDLYNWDIIVKKIYSNE